MSAPALGRRLSAVASFVPADSCVADVGTDHAKLPCALLADGRARKAWALDLAAGPIAALRSRRLPAAVEVRRGSGLAPMHPGEADVVTICGMGGHTVARILMDAPRAVVAGLVRVVLQPNDHAELARAALVAMGWSVVEEALVEERGRWYPVVVGGPGSGWRAVEDSLALQVGPLLLGRGDGGLRQWLVAEHARATAILAASPGALPMREWARRTEAALRRMDQVDA